MPSHADGLPWPLSLFHFDFYVNTTPSRAIATLQRTVNQLTASGYGVFPTLAVDGQWGPQTENALRQPLPKVAPQAYLMERLLAYEDIVKGNPVKATPLWKEWIPRVADLYRRFT